jgi:hypothetical protein
VRAGLSATYNVSWDARGLTFLNDNAESAALQNPYYQGSYDAFGTFAREAILRSAAQPAPAAQPAQ